MKKQYKIFYPYDDYISEEKGGWEMRLRPLGPKFDKLNDAEEWLAQHINTLSTHNPTNHFIILPVYSK